MSRVSNQIVLRLVSIVVLSMTLGSLASVASSTMAVASPTIPTCHSSQLIMTVDQGAGAYSAAGNQGVPSFISILVTPLANSRGTQRSDSGLPRLEDDRSHSPAAVAEYSRARRRDWLC